jgi:alpha-L-fucosidase
MANRKDFIKQLTIAGATVALAPSWVGFNKQKGRNKNKVRSKIPSYLLDYAHIYAKDPHKAALAWFRDARFGLFMHYGLYSLLGRGEWVQLREKIPVAGYEKLKTKFTAKNFNPDFITDLALAAGMKYINITSKHHEGFCLFKTDQTDYNSVGSAAKRDIVGELKDACDKKGIGLFLYYSIAADWHYPYFLPRKAGWTDYRPAYAHHQPEYLDPTGAKFQKYLTYARTQIRELVIQYRPAGIWFDPLMGFYARPDLFPMKKIYKEIRSLCPNTLVSFKQGATGTEDFAAPERGAGSPYKTIKKRFGESSALIAQKAWEKNKHKHNETCNTLQPHWWGYDQAADGKHKKANQVLDLLHRAKRKNMNLLLNTGPLPDGSIYPEDVRTLRLVGRRIAVKS